MTEKIQTYLAFGSFFATIATAWIIWQQLGALKSAAQAGLSDSLLSQSIEIIKQLAGSPDLRPYFYDNKSLLPDVHNEAELQYIAEMIANFLEHVYLQRKDLPEGAADSWLRYVRGAYEDSEVLRHFIFKHRKWYSRDLLDYLGVASDPSEPFPWYLR